VCSTPLTLPLRRTTRSAGCGGLASNPRASACRVREQQLRIQERMRSAEATTLPPMNRAIDLMVCTSKAAQELPEYSGERQSKLLWLVLKEASGKAGELRMSLQEPFQKLRLSNSASAKNHNELGAKSADFDTWRATVDAFRTFLASSPSIEQLSNSGNDVLIQQLRAPSVVTDPPHPTTRDASRTVHTTQPIKADPHAKNTGFKRGQSGKPETQFKRGNPDRRQPEGKG